MSSLPASIKRIESKATEKRWRHHFPHYKSMGAFCCHGQHCFDPICLKTLCSLSPPPVMLHIKFDQDWPTRLRDIQVQKCKIFIIQGQVTPKMSSLTIRPEIKLVQDFMPILVTSNYDDDSIKNERASMEKAFSHYKSYGKIFRHSRAANSVVSGPIWPKFELVQDFMHVLVTCKYKKDWIKKNREKVETSFSHYKSMGAFCCHRNQGFDPICPKTLCSLSPTPVMLHIKFDQDWPTSFRDIQVWKCGRRRWRTTDDDDGPMVYYKLTLWAFGSGELKKKMWVHFGHIFGAK